jgi:hypothetical protein
MRIVYEKVLGPIVLSSDAATMTKDRPACNVFSRPLAAWRLATCTNRYPTCLKFISCVTFRWTNPLLPLLNAVART